MAGTPEAVLTQQDFNLIPLLNTLAEPVAGSVTASAANVGRFYRNTSTGNFEYVFNATTVVHFTISGQIADADIASGAAIALSKLATNPLARANHTGTQLAATISDFDSQVNTHHPNDLAAMNGDLNANGHKVTGAADPTAATDYTTQQWVLAQISAAISGHDYKDAVRVASTSSVTIASPGANVDGVAMNSGDRVLLAGQSTGSQNGIYIYNGSASAMTRATDANTSAMVTEGMTVPIAEGTHAATFAILTTGDPITLGTTALSFTILSAGAVYTQGTGITITGTTIALSTPVSVANGGTNATSASAARTSLNVPQRGFASDIGALTAGTGLDIVHSLGTLDVICQVYRKSDGATVRIGTLRKDTNTVTVTSDVAVSSGVLRLIVEPIQ